MTVRSRAHPISQRESSAAGFTLVEMLIALVIIAVMTALMVAFMGQVRTLLRIENASEAEAQVDAVTLFLETMISNAEPLPLLPSAPDHVLYFKGSRSEIQLSAIQPIGFGSNALRQVTLALRRVGDAGSSLHDLVLVGKPRRARSQSDGPETEVVLVRDVAGLEFSYMENSDQQISWQQVWDNPRRLPMAVQIKLTISRGGKAYPSKGMAKLKLAAAQ